MMEDDLKRAAVKVEVDDWVVWEDWKHNANFRSNPVFQAAQIGSSHAFAEMTPFYHTRLGLYSTATDIIAKGTKLEMVALANRLQKLCEQREQAIKIAEDNVIEVASEEIKKIRAAIKDYNKEAKC
jgi:hypothetical protein